MLLTFELSEKYTLLNNDIKLNKVQLFEIYLYICVVKLNFLHAI